MTGITERIMHSEKKTCRTYQTNKKNEQQLILVMNVSTLVYTTYVHDSEDLTITVKSLIIKVFEHFTNQNGFRISKIASLRFP